MSVFTLSSGRLAIGDPTMGMALVDHAVTGEFRLRPGALKMDSNASPQIDLDWPALFVFDAEKLEQFNAWYHRVGGETGYNLMSIESRLAEAERELGVRIGFYWQNELDIDASDGTYCLDTAMIEPVA